MDRTIAGCDQGSGEEYWNQKLASLVNQDYTIIGGVDAVVDILNTVDRGTEKHIMENSGNRRAGTCRRNPKEDVRIRGYSCCLTTVRFSVCLRDVDNNELAVALKGSNEEVQNANL